MKFKTPFFFATPFNLLIAFYILLSLGKKTDWFRFLGVWKSSTKCLSSTILESSLAHHPAHTCCPSCPTGQSSTLYTPCSIFLLRSDCPPAPACMPCTLSSLGIGPCTALFTIRIQRTKEESKHFIIVELLQE